MGRERTLARSGARTVGRLDDPVAEHSARSGTADAARLRSGRGRHPVDLGAGTPLGAGVGRHGLDLSTVRVHHDGAAARLTEAHGANAVTVGNDIAFAPGRYRPGTPGGDALLEHELGHVAQQADAGTTVLQRDGRHGSGPGERPPAEPFEVVDDGSLGTEDDHLTFERNSIAVDDSVTERLRRLVAQHPGPVTVELHGYASEDGNQQYNVNLSAQRAAVVGRVVQMLLPQGSVVRLIAHGTSTGFGERPEDNRRVGIDLSDRVPMSQAFGLPSPPPSLLGIPELTVDSRLLAPRATPVATTTPPVAGTVFNPRVDFPQRDPSLVADVMFGAGAVPSPSVYGPNSAVVSGVDWARIYSDARGRGAQLTLGDNEIIARHYVLYYPLARAAYDHIPGVSVLFDSPRALANTFTGQMVNSALARDNPTSLEAFQNEIDRMRSIMGLPLGVQTPSIPLLKREF